MKKSFAAFLLFVVLKSFTSCQKELSLEPPSNRQQDSLTLVKTIESIYYDEFDVFMAKLSEQYIYDSILNQTVVNFTDSGSYVSPPQVTRYTETFQYDGNDKLVQFTSTSPYHPISKLDFVYDASGELAKTVMDNQYIARAIVTQFSTAMVNNQKVVSSYDTTGWQIPAPSGRIDSRPEICRYTFNDKNQLVKRSLYSTSFKEPSSLFKDTTIDVNMYNSNGYFAGSNTSFSYFSFPAAPAPFVTYQELSYTREGNSAVLLNSLMHIYRSVYWYTIDEYYNGFADALNSFTFGTHLGPPINSGTLFFSDHTNPSSDVHEAGQYQNSFDSKGLPVRIITPKKFGNKYGGRMEASYTYTAIKK